MHLHDQIMQEGPGIVYNRSRSALPSAVRWATAVAAAPIRYVLTDEVRDECVDISAKRQELLEPTSNTPRVPHETMWIEWRDLRSSPLSPAQPGRVGILVRSDGRGRSGTAHVVYETGSGPIMGQLRVDFDFDNPRDTRGELLNEAFPGLPLDRGTGLLLRHCSFGYEQDWDQYFASAQQEGKLTRQMLAEMTRAAVPDFVFLSSFLLLLGVDRMVEGRPSDLARLNKARARAGRPALLDHVEVRLSLLAKVGNGGRGGERAASRLHQVRGHLVRRAGKTFWRTTHLRGNAAAGMIASRTIHVTR